MPNQTDEVRHNETLLQFLTGTPAGTKNEVTPSVKDHVLVTAGPHEGIRGTISGIKEEEDSFTVSLRNGDVSVELRRNQFETRESAEMVEMAYRLWDVRIALPLLNLGRLMLALGAAHGVADWRNCGIKFIYWVGCVHVTQEPRIFWTPEEMPVFAWLCSFDTNTGLICAYCDFAVVTAWAGQRMRRTWCCCAWTY